MHKNINNLIEIQKEINLKSGIKNLNPRIIAVSKTFPIKEILPLIEYGHIDFGENKVQEAVEKWTDIKMKYKFIKLHMIGKLQTNKVKYAVKLFDYIHSLDSIKLAEKISSEQIKLNKNLNIFIQINIANEPQKSGIKIEDLENFYKICTDKLKLNIVGFMCLPPADVDSSENFKIIQKLTEKFKTKELSIGMSSDYLIAVKFGATFLRIGSKIFGERS